MTDNNNLYCLFEERIARGPTRPAFVTPAGAVTTYGELGQDVSRMANALAAAGVKAGDRVTVQVEKSLPNAVLYLACLKAGAVFNPLNSGYTSAELDYFLGDAQPSLLVCQTSNLSVLQPIAAARKIALSIANSPLVKTAIAGQDANWGRIVMAVGKSGEAANRDKLSIKFGGHRVATQGQRDPNYSEALMARYMQRPEIEIDVDVGISKFNAGVWTCDLTHGYIDINGSYRS